MFKRVPYYLPLFKFIQGFIYACITKEIFLPKLYRNLQWLRFFVVFYFRFRVLKKATQKWNVVRVPTCISNYPYSYECHNPFVV